MFYTYILENNWGRLYIGQTGNLSVRVEWHNAGKSVFTKNKGPWKLIFKKAFGARSEALRYERYLKKLKNSFFIRKNIIGV